MNTNKKIGVYGAGSTISCLDLALVQAILAGEWCSDVSTDGFIAIIYCQSIYLEVLPHLAYRLSSISC
ncbi:hypothetical protein [Cylindrospermum sp. FACHB-282]|uniref:hypothetical protein n=1 Tax=Cylindrospermum sp. FACHB-282 TaxID=2692794 RepID=UPI00168759DE|nr:hypothetical protein [Cylindrospermum sp. FACHB-282]MBD2388240.1 hypothetical protein [Cylindrospermum sp. FACHB-282]